MKTISKLALCYLVCFGYTSSVVATPKSPPTTPLMSFVDDESKMLHFRYTVEDYYDQTMQGTNSSIFAIENQTAVVECKSVGDVIKIIKSSMPTYNAYTVPDHIDIVRIKSRKLDKIKPYLMNMKVHGFVYDGQIGNLPAELGKTTNTAVYCSNYMGSEIDSVAVLTTIVHINMSNTESYIMLVDTSLPTVSEYGMLFNTMTAPIAPKAKTYKTIIHFIF